MQSNLPPKVRHVLRGYSSRNCVAYQGPFPEEWEVRIADEGGWVQPQHKLRVNVPTKEVSYEEGLKCYTTWTEECAEADQQLLVIYTDFGMVRHRGLWLGIVLLGALRGKYLDDIEVGISDDMQWLRLAQRFAREPELLRSNLKEMESLFMWARRDSI